MDLHETNIDHRPDPALQEDLKIFDAKAFRKDKITTSFETRAIDQHWKNRTFLSSLDFAWSGIRQAVREERNMKTHLAAAGLVGLAGLFFQVTAMEWLFLLSAIFGVVTLELVNSAIENLVDLVCGPRFSDFAKAAKDMAAGAVLLWSVYAALVGLLVFVPKVLALLF